MGIYSIDLYKEESTEHLVFLLSDYIKEEHLRRFQISEREKQDPLVTTLVVKCKGSIIWKN